MARPALSGQQSGAQRGPPDLLRGILLGPVPGTFVCTQLSTFT
ncbi:hypothetical protein ACFY2G_35450 [Streptomyces collinus]|nr:hypothetical protein [Streptomyces sp. WI03-4A]